MKIQLLCFLAFTCGSLVARKEAIPDTISPDKKYHVVVAEVGNRISYLIKDIPGGATLLSVPSSYQSDLGAAGWSFEQALGATVKWRDDSLFIAIDEANHNRIGTVLIARRTPRGFQNLPIAEEELKRSSKQPWESCRLFFGEWGGTTLLPLWCMAWFSVLIMVRASHSASLLPWT